MPYFQRKSIIKINLTWKNGLFFLFVYLSIYLVEVFSLYKVFKVAFLKYEIVDKIHSFKGIVLWENLVIIFKKF
jgi:hypothetical protein